MGQKLLPRVITLINGDGRPITCFINSSFQTLIYLDFSLVIEKINEMNSNFFKVEEQVYVKKRVLRLSAADDRNICLP